MAWTLYELSRRPDYQARVREEIRSQPADYDSTPLLNAAINVLIFPLSALRTDKTDRNPSVCILSCIRCRDIQ